MVSEQRFATGVTRVGTRAHAARSLDIPAVSLCGVSLQAVAIDHDYETLPMILRCEICDRSLAARTPQTEDES